MTNEFTMIPLNHYFLKEEGLGIEAKEFYEYLIMKCDENRKFVLPKRWQLYKDFQMDRYGLAEEEINYAEFDFYETYFDYLKAYGYIMVKKINGDFTLVIPKGCYNYFKGKMEVEQ